MLFQQLVNICTCTCIAGTDLLITLTGNHTYASVKGHEEYAFLKACFKPVREEVGEMISNPVISISGKEYHMNIVFGSDYKVAKTYVYMYSYVHSMGALNRVHAVVGIRVIYWQAFFCSF